MSEILKESEWTALLKNAPFFSDQGVQGALKGYEKAKNAAAMSDALKELISTVALTKKKNPKSPATKKILKSLDSIGASAEAELTQIASSDGDDGSLKSGLNLAKNSPTEFAICIGDSLALAVARKITKAHRDEIKKRSSGNKVVEGLVQWNKERKAYVFQLEGSAPRGGGKALRATIAETMGKVVNVVLLVGGQELVEDEGESEIRPREEPLKTHSESSSPRPDPLEDEWREISARLTAKFKTALKADPGLGGLIKKAMSQSEAFVETRKFKAAVGLYEQVEAKLDQAIAAPEKSFELAARFKQRLAGVVGIARPLLSGRTDAAMSLARVYTLMEGLAKTGQFEEALPLLDEIEALSQRAQEEARRESALQSKLADWTKAADVAAKSLQDLRSAVSKFDHPVAREIEDLVAEFLQRLKVPPRTVELAGEMGRVLDGSDTSALQLKNPFGFTIDLRGPLKPLLADLIEILAA